MSKKAQGATLSQAARQSAADALRQRATRLRAEADHFDALAELADTLEVGSKTEVALWNTALERRH